MPSTSRPRPFPRLRRLRAPATGNWLARGYLAVFAASFPPAVLFPDSGFAVGPLLLTAPLSLTSVVLPFGPGTEGSAAAEALATGLWLVWLLLCALLNAAALGSLAASRGAAAPAGAPRPRRLRALLAPAVDNGLARGYLAVVAASLGVFLYAVHLSPDPGFSAGVTLSGLINATLLGRLAHGFRAPEARR